MPLTLYNTLTRRKEEFAPLVPGQVGLYTCGPTVYGPPHLGNLRTYVFEDVLKRILLANGLKVNHVMNITDVGHLTSDADEGEDKMEKGARAEGKSVWDMVKLYTAMFKQNMRDLNILEPNVWCKATDHIPEQIALIQKLETKGFAYQINDGIYFDTSQLSDYGKLARLDVKGLKVGARVEANPEKRNPTDFALWKFSPTPPAGGQKRQMEWPSPWGVGFPGWHIECSAMSMKYLGETFDIHAGGIDLIPVHHTNEIAQSEAATGKQFVKYWLHGEFLVEHEKKLAKSEGTTLTLDWFKKQGLAPLAYRYFCLGTHYRKPLTFSLAAVQGAAKALQNLQDKVATMGAAAIGCAEFEERFMSAVNDDLNTPQALAVVWELMKSAYPDSAKKQSLLKFDEVLGLGLKDVPPLTIPEAVLGLQADREAARAAKDWARADALRQEIATHGFTVDDTEFGSVIKRVR